MAKYIDAEKLIHELEERIFAYSKGYAEGDDSRKDAIETLLKDVRYQCSLQHEQQEVDLEKEIDRVFFKRECGSQKLTHKEAAQIGRHFAEWGVEHLKK